MGLGYLMKPKQAQTMLKDGLWGAYYTQVTHTSQRAPGISQHGHTAYRSTSPASFVCDRSGSAHTSAARPDMEEVILRYKGQGRHQFDHWVDWVDWVDFGHITPVRS